MLRKIMPTRDAAEPREDDEEICDLDVILSRRVTFTYKGRVRAILPITTERLFAFWAAGQEYKKSKFETAAEENRAFYGILKTVCDDISLSDVADMASIQKANLLEHIARKVTGKEPVDEHLKKKVIDPQSP